MIFFTPDRKEIQKNITKYKRNPNKKSLSKAQAKLGTLIEQLYPNIPVYEEVPCFGTKLRLDFYVPFINLAFEFDGEQHKKFNIFFHGTKANWVRQRQRDKEKEYWCNINNIILVRVTGSNLSIHNLEILIDKARNGQDF